MFKGVQEVSGTSTTVKPQMNDGEELGLISSKLTNGGKQSLSPEGICGKPVVILMFRGGAVPSGNSPP